MGATKRAAFISSAGTKRGYLSCQRRKKELVLVYESEHRVELYKHSGCLSRLSGDLHVE